MTNHAVSNRADLREHTKTMSRHGDRRGQIADFRDSFETINWLYLLFKCGIKTKTHFEWLLWHWSSLGQLNLEPTRPNGLVGCKVPTDLVKISVKEAMHMGFHYILPRRSFTRTMVHTCTVSVCRRTDRRTDKVQPITNILLPPSQEENGIAIATNVFGVSFIESSIFGRKITIREPFLPKILFGNLR